MRLGILARPPKSSLAQAGGCLEPDFHNYIYIHFIFQSLLKQAVTLPPEFSSVHTSWMEIKYHHLLVAERIMAGNFRR